MGAHFKTVWFSLAAFLAALLFIVSAVLLCLGGDSIADESNGTALIVSELSGIVMLVYSLSMILGRNILEKTTGALILVSGILFLAAPLIDGYEVTVFAAAGLVAAVGIVGYTVYVRKSHVYGVMYISAIMAAIAVVTGILLVVSDYQQYCGAIMLLAIAVWLALAGWVTGFVLTESVTKARKVVEDKAPEKKEKPQAQNKKATPKAKKVEKKEEPKVEPEPEPVKKEAVKVEEKEEPKAEPEPEPVKEVKKQKPPAKAMGDFMEKLMSSDKANAVSRKKEEPAEELVVKPAEESKPAKEEPKAEPEPEGSVIATPVEPKENEFRVKEPDWGAVSRDSAAGKEPEEIVPKTAEKEKPVKKKTVKAEKKKPEAEPVKEETVTGEIVLEEAVPESAEVVSGEIVPEEEELGEDLYTDNSPEALVRRAAWNKGLRCRRSYGPACIPVAFVKGKVAVYVDGPEPDTSGDAALEAEGWTVLRFSAADVTDGLKQGEEIATVVRERSRALRKKKK